MRRLAVGPVAEVHLAHAHGRGASDKLVVIKRMTSTAAKDKALVEKFLSEARLAAQLDHDNIVRVEKIDVDRDNYYYVMEYVRGADLRTVLQALAQRRGTMPLECAIAIGIALCTALEHAYDRHHGLTHHGITPGKVLLSDTGDIKLGGWGIAEDHKDRTIGYQSPEQCVGPFVDRRTDVFSIGALLYELTTGVHPFNAASAPEMLAEIVCCAVAPPSHQRADFSPMLGAILMRCLRKEPADRYQSAGELGSDLVAFQRKYELSTAPSAIGELVATASRVLTPRQVATIDAPPTAPPEQSAIPRAESPSMAFASSSVVLPQIVRWHQKWWAMGIAGVILAGLGISGVAVYRTQYTPAPPLYIGRPAPPEIPVSASRARPPKPRQVQADEPDRERRAPSRRVTETRPTPAPPPPPPPVPEPALIYDAYATIGSIDVRGPLPSVAVRKSIEGALPALRSCYKAAARGRGLPANASLGLLFDIDRTRMASNVRTNNDKSLGSLPGCAVMALGKLRTSRPPAEGTSHVYLTIDFRGW